MDPLTGLVSSVRFYKLFNHLPTYLLTPFLFISPNFSTVPGLYIPKSLRPFLKFKVRFIFSLPLIGHTS